MDKNYIAVAIIICISVLVLLLFVKKSQIRQALFSFFVAQSFSWPITLSYVYFNLQSNPFRLFPHATDSNFLFAFIFYPSIYVVYYLYYPKKAGFVKRLLYSILMPALALFTQLLADLFTDLIYYPQKWTLISAFLLLFALYNIARKYIDEFFQKFFIPQER